MNKRHLLFVEPQGQRLAQIMRDLAAVRPDWHIVRTTSMDAALELMSQYRFSLILAGFGTDKAACELFFEQAKGRDASVIRTGLIEPPKNGALSGALDFAHQCLQSSCMDTQIQSTIVRGLKVWEKSQDNPRLVDFVADVKNIPTPPMLYFDIKDELESPNGSLREVAHLLERDPALTGKILKVANSGFYGFPRTIADLGEAVSLLGSDMVLALVLGATLYEQLPLPGLNIDKLWMHSVAISTLAKKITADEGGNRQSASAAGIAGLLHDVGQLVFLINDAAAYFSIIHASQGDERKLVIAEREQFGVDHAQLGGHLLALWGLPDSIVDAVALHHSWGEAHQQSESGELVTTKSVYVAEWLLQEYFTYKELFNGCTEPDSLHALASSHAAKWWRSVEELVEQGMLG